ncbi:lytic transglycosylase domain-containing protein [Campylobacter geochelonis]|uniref:lytic transglycosylase domain-containing protein n=1 Tax=Campylobacter geochelonis TaxID=1780362 RepID=UPI00094CD1C0|nr:lytic transglycosylase domain-containing protein [Campylobacter geochelonis]
MLLRCSFVLMFFISLNASVLSYEEIKKEPKSLAKDYYIYRLITETKYDKNEIKELKKDIFRNKGKLQTQIDKILPPFKKQDNCNGIGSKNILDANLSCKLARMFPNFIKSISQGDREALIKEFASRADLINLLQGYNQKNPAKYYAKTQNAKNFFIYYNSINQQEQDDKFNFALEPEFAQTLATKGYFKTFVVNSVLQKKHEVLTKSLLELNTTVLSDDSAFFLGLQALKFNKPKKANELFFQAKTTYKKQFDKDKSSFWMYQTSKDINLLKELSNSQNINIYSLYAKEMTGNNQVEVVIPQPTKKSVKGYDSSDPFAWVKLKEKVKTLDLKNLEKYADKFDTKNTVGEYIYIANILSGYKDNFYPMPFMDYLKDTNIHRKALIFALARQESRFVQSAVSTSYALGMMQFMPFVANDIAKKNKLKDFDQDEMFKPEVAYKFANIHLDWLERYLYNPVFIAYAYNGGLGFTKRTLLRGDLFNDGKYEPFLSMELVPVQESREYAKHVLANYVIYLQALSAESNTSILTLLKTLTIPSLSDSFRK